VSAALPPEPAELPEELGSDAPARLDPDASLTELALVDLQLPAQHVKGVALTASSLLRVDLSASRLLALRITDATLKACELANVDASGAALLRVGIASCRLTGIRFTEAALRDVTISGSRVDLATFGFSKLTRVTFEDCNLTQSAFLDATLEDVRFHGCDLTAADFRGARTTRCEFRDSRVDELEGAECLRGSAMPWPDIVAAASVFADALGIAVIDDADALETRGGDEDR
jgi:uncharacterized protein YjbI with pentapeptide repeats